MKTFKFWSTGPSKDIFDIEALHQFLILNGFGTYRSDQFKGTLLVKQEGRIIKIVNPKLIREYCWHYIKSEHQFSDAEERKQVKNEFQKNKSLFNKDNLELLSKIVINEIKDDDKTSYMFFRNCILKITEDGITKHSYDGIEGQIFEKDIINFELKTNDVNVLNQDGEFLQFLRYICWDEDFDRKIDNINSLFTIIGFLLHRYKNPSLSRAVILMDDYNGSGPNGGTGKTLLTNALSHVRSATLEDGKYFNVKERFTLSSVTYDTRVLIIDDLPHNFDLEKLFPLITGSARVERKFENKITLPFEVSPKIVLTSNYPFTRTEESFKRRKIEFVLSNYFSSSRTPESIFGHLFFTGWDHKNWEDFYLLMANCISDFLTFGIKEQDINVAERTLKMQAHPKFIDYAKSQLTTGIKYNKKEVYNEYFDQNPEVVIIELTTFRLWLKLFADANKFKFTESHSGNDNFFQYSLE